MRKGTFRSDALSVRAVPDKFGVPNGIRRLSKMHDFSGETGRFCRLRDHEIPRLT